MIKPVAWMKVENYTDDSGLWEQSISFNTDGDGVPLYAIPETHRIVSAELLERIAAWLQPGMVVEEELRAIISNK